MGGDVLERLKVKYDDLNLGYVKAVFSEMGYSKFKEYGSGIVVVCDDDEVPQILANYCGGSIFEGDLEDTSTVTGLCEREDIHFGFLFRGSEIDVYAFDVSRRPVADISLRFGYEVLNMLSHGFDRDKVSRSFRDILKFRTNFTNWFYEQRSNPSGDFIHFLADKFGVVEVSTDVLESAMVCAINDVCEFGDYLTALEDM